MAYDKRKFLYHKALSELSPVRVTVDGAIRQIKTKRGPADVVDLTIQPQGVVPEQVTYFIESPACANVFVNQKGNTFTVQASGSRDSATIQYLGQPGSAVGVQQPPAYQQPNAPAPAYQAPTTQPQAMPPPPPAKSADVAVLDAKAFVARNLTFSTIALKAAISLKLTAENELKTTLPDVVFVAIYNSCCFGASAAGIVDKLPTKVDYNTLKSAHTSVETKSATPPPPPPPPKPKCSQCGADMADDGRCLNGDCPTNNVPF